MRAYASALSAPPATPLAPENPAGGGGGGSADALPSNQVALLNAYANEPHTLSPGQQNEARQAIKAKMGGGW